MQSSPEDQMLHNWIRDTLLFMRTKIMLTVFLLLKPLAVFAAENSVRSVGIVFFGKKSEQANAAVCKRLVAEMSKKTFITGKSIPADVS